MLHILEILFTTIGALVFGFVIYDRFFQKDKAIIGNFPLVGRMRYLFHELRPFFRQYFGDDNAFAPRIVIDWIRNVAEGKSGYFAFDKFDTTHEMHDGLHQMIHSNSPYNADEMEPKYPVIGEKRKHPLHFHTYFYRSAMSLGSLSFEATSAMAKACADIQVPFNTGEGGLSIHHLPNLQFSYDKKFLKYKKLPFISKIIWKLLPGIRLKNRWVEFLGNTIKPEMGERDLFLLDVTEWLLYTIDWDADLEVFPKPEHLTNEYGKLILQIGSGLYGMREKRTDGKIKISWERFQKTASFARAIEIKLAQGAKQTGGILKAMKNTKTISTIRGVHPNIDLVSPNRFPFYAPGDTSGFFDFLEKASSLSGGKPIGMKIVISDKSNIESIVQEISKQPKEQGPDFITIDGGDGGTGAAPISLGVLYGRKIYDALQIAVETLETYGVRDRVKILAAAKLYAPHMSARAIALGADAIGNARSIMIAGGCIRAGVCSGENGTCPVGMATMNKNNRRAYQQVWDTKVKQIKSYIMAHNKGLIQVAAVAGVKSPSLLNTKHVMPSKHTGIPLI